MSEHKDFQWVIRIHWDEKHTSPAIGPFGQTEADYRMRQLRRRLRDAGLTPPKMKRELLRSPDVLDGWIQDRIKESKLDALADDPLRGPVCAHCGQPIEPTGGHDWIGPIPEPGEPQKRYHLSTDFPECRLASGACGEER